MSILFLCSFYITHTTAQNKQDTQEYAIMTYNVENLFDTNDDEGFNDEDFTPQGKYHWTNKLLRKKVGQIAKVIATANKWNPPVVVGLCEVENDNVLKYLTKGSPLKNLKYNFIHFDSPDPRDIDVALLYRHELFTPITTQVMAATDKTCDYTTRDILYVSGKLANDTIHIFMCHFPSRSKGEAFTEPRRMKAAGIVRHAVDSIWQTNKLAKIIIMGDFNDYPTNRSVTEALKAGAPTESPEQNTLYDLCYPLQQNPNLGSYNFRQEWGMLDHIIISGTLLQKKSKLTTANNNIYIYAPEWILESDGKEGYRPFRTFYGTSYHGGYSDHLP
ncbi:MAG: endonuclease/exonuclease/phosphatase family protein, partial [Bacteroidales bacterium]|nr:endonuclease/exonuclease/phosphatase family protein [Bacteroidales bacterium]